MPCASLVSTPHNVAFATATNLAIAAATGATLVVARPNLVPLEGWLPPLLETLHRRGTAVVQCLVLSSDDLIASAGGVFASECATPERLLEGFPISDVLRIGEAFRVPAALSGVLAVRTIDAIACRGFDPLVGNSMTDVDFSLRLAEAARGITMVDTRSRMRGQAPGRFGFPHDWGLAARVLAERWASPPDGSRALWAAAGLEVDGYREVSLPSTTGPPVRVLRAELRRRRPVATIREQPPRLRWVIDTAAPSGPRGEQWGDTHFARALARALTSLGQDVAVDVRDARSRSSRRFDDVVLVLRGLDRVIPSMATVNIEWVISHPEAVDDQELHQFDRVFAASRPWAARASARSAVDVRPLLQCTDPASVPPRSRRARHRSARSLRRQLAKG